MFIRSIKANIELVKAQENERENDHDVENEIDDFKMDIASPYKENPNSKHIYILMMICIFNSKCYN